MVVSLVYKNFPHRQMHHSYTRIAGLGMSALGHERKSGVGLEMSAFGGKADLKFGRRDFRV